MSGTRWTKCGFTLLNGDKCQEPPVRLPEGEPRPKCEAHARMYELPVGTKLWRTWQGGDWTIIEVRHPDTALSPGTTYVVENRMGWSTVIWPYDITRVLTEAADR